MEDVVVLGAGWAGLAAAHHLRRRGMDPLVLEQGHAVGGAARTYLEDGWLLEAGPHAFFPEHPALRQFLEDAGGREDLVAGPSSSPRFLTRRGRRVALPGSPPDLVRTEVLSARAKLRLLVEPLIPSRPDPEESVKAFAHRRFGEGTDHLLDAMVSGVFAGDPARLSADLSFPRLAAAEREHGSVLLGLLQGDRPRRGSLAAPLAGMGPWLADRAAPLRVELGQKVLRLEGDGPFHIVLDEGSYDARQVILAVPPDAAAALLDVALEPLPHAPVASIGLGWSDGSEVRRHFAGYGVLNPAVEARFTLGVLYESSLFPGRAPDGGCLVRALVGGRRQPQRAALDQDQLVARTVEDVLELHDLKRPPDWTHVLRPPPIPQPELGHVRHLAPLVERATRLSHLKIAGWGWRGVGISEVVQSGLDAAQAVLRDNTLS